MKKLLVLTTALTAIGFAANADVTVMSWGGAYGEAQTEAFVKPFIAATGKATIMVDSDNPAPAIKAMVEAGNVTVDVASVEYADAIRLCDEGVLEPIDAASLPAGAAGPGVTLWMRPSLTSTWETSVSLALRLSKTTTSLNQIASFGAGVATDTVVVLSRGVIAQACCTFWWHVEGRPDGHCGHDVLAPLGCQIAERLCLTRCR